MTAYYNERDKYAAEWLRNLIASGHLPAGDVDERDIRDVTPAELFRYTQCHFFAGIGVWPHALRRAQWPDDRPIWTGSCPCQPFSAAGARAGFDDERHLWPHWHWLVDQCRPAVVAGEQVASKDGLGWLDLVSADLEASGYAFAAADLCAAGVAVDWDDSQPGEWLRRAIHDCADRFVERTLRSFAAWAGENLAGDGGDHIRQRLYFVGLGDLERSRLEGRRGPVGGEYHEVGQALPRGSAGRMDDPAGARRDGQVEGPEGDSWDKARVRRPSAGRHTGGLSDSSNDHRGGGERRKEEGAGPDGKRRRRPAGHSSARGLADVAGGGREVAVLDDGCGGAPAGLGETSQHGGRGAPDVAGARDGCGRGPDWLLCRDAKWRAVETGTFPLAHAPPARVGRLRAYGNALDAETATRFAEVLLSILEQAA